MKLLSFAIYFTETKIGSATRNTLNKKSVTTFQQFAFSTHLYAKQ